MAVAGGLTWEETTATVYVGQTITVPITSDSSKNEVPGFGPTEVADIVSASGTELQIIGQSEGTLTIPAGTTWIEESPALDMATTNSFTLTVLPDEPKVAKQSQWEDLANRVKNASINVKVLTTADNNDTVDGRDCINPAYLSPGFYTTNDVDGEVYFKYIDGSRVGSRNGKLWCVTISGQDQMSLENISGWSTQQIKGKYIQGDGAVGRYKISTGEDIDSQIRLTGKSLTEFYDSVIENGLIHNGGTTAPTTSTAGEVGTQYTYVDTTGTPTAHLCVCTEVDKTDPQNPVYTWQQLI